MYLRVRSVIRRRNVISIVGIIAINVVVGWPYNLAVNAALIPFLYFWHRIENRKLLAGCPITLETMSVRESTAAAAGSFSIFNLWFFSLQVYYPLLLGFG